MRKLNTYQFYRLAKAVEPVLNLREEDTTLADIFSVLYAASSALRPLVADRSILSPSSKRAAANLLRSINAVGIPESWKDLSSLDFKMQIDSFRVSSISGRARDFETVLANDLPGLDVYHVSAIGIYSTPALIEHAESALLEGLSEECQESISDTAKRDFNQAGRCLAFDLSTAAGFHVMRAVEAVLRDYWHQVLQPSPGTRAPDMAQCINELRKAGEDAKVLDVLDHIRDLHRNTLMHPDAFLEAAESLRLFDIAKSGISAMAERMNGLKRRVAAKANSEASELSGIGEDLSLPATESES